MDDEQGFGKLTAALGSLAENVVEPPAWLLGTVTESLVEKARRAAAASRVKQQVGNPKVIGGGALLVAGLAGAFILRGRRRRRRGVATKLRGALAA